MSHIAISTGSIHFFIGKLSSACHIICHVIFHFSKIAQLDTEGFDATLEHRPAQGAFR